MQLVLHGTSMTYTEFIRERGLVPPPGHGVGVRVRTKVDEAMDDARAVAAYVTYREEGGISPKGIIVTATVPNDWLSTDDAGTLRVPGLGPTAIEIRGPHDFTDEFFDPNGGARQALFDSLERWEQMTDNRIAHPFPRRKVRRS